MLDIHIRFQRDDFEIEFKHQLSSHITGLFGPSGSGKSTILSLIAGILTPQEGHIKLDETTLFDSSKGINTPSFKRKVAMIFQEHRLFPHLKVISNLRYGYDLIPNNDRKFEINSIIDLLELSEHLGKLPHELSGGEAQRVALGRGLLMSPNLLLLDEPLTSLDQRLKDQIIPYLERVIQDIDIPMIYVSHDKNEIEQISEVIIKLG
jgi:molybdate transport system ATP-binding protein